jgi:hypothetical protein
LDFLPLGTSYDASPKPRSRLGDAWIIARNDLKAPRQTGFVPRKDKHLLFCCAGRVGIFGSTFPSIIEGDSKQNLEKMSTMAGERGVVSVTPFEAP